MPDDVEVIDLTPDELIQRLNEGKVYAEDQAQRALKNYFKQGNLTALRELALRRTAERVDDQMRQYMRRHAIRGTWAASERLLVCVNESAGAAQLIRRAKRVADRLNAPWFAVYVETARYHQLNEAQRLRIADTLRLAESLGAQTLTLPGSRRIADDLVSYAHDNNITQIVVGKSVRPWWFEWLHGSVVHELVQQSASASTSISWLKMRPMPMRRRKAPRSSARYPRRHSNRACGTSCAAMPPAPAWSRGPPCWAARW